MANETEQSSEGVRPFGPELRLLDRRAFVGFPELGVAPGIQISDFALQIPDVTFPLNVSGGAAKYQKRKLDFGYLELHVDAEVIRRRVDEVGKRLTEIEDLKLAFRPGYIEGQARLRSAERTPFTFKVAFDGDGERLVVYLYDVRLYGFCSTPSARLPAILAEAASSSGALADLERKGASGFTARVLPMLVELAAVGRGFKMPSLDQARLSEANVSPKGVSLRFASGGLPPPSPPDEDLLLMLEGVRAFADAEEFVAENKLADARDAYLKLGDATDAHPFAIERLLSLLVADESSHDLALDVAQTLGRRREKSGIALWGEAVVRERRGELARAAERYLALAGLARQRREESSAFLAAEAGARAARDSAPHMAVKALHEVLGLKPDHVPSLKALARASDQAKDRAGAIRAYRRLAALARDPLEAAEAHVHLARLCAQTEDDLAGARLHCEAALKLSPDHPDALLQLGELCFKSGEHLRAVKALDRLREVALGRHEVDRVGRANLLAGQVWETGLNQPENALLRYREAVSLLPGEGEPHFFVGRVAEALGRVQEAVASYQQAIELSGPTPKDQNARTASHQSHHALARLFKTKLGEPNRAKEHLELAWALEPKDMAALGELLPHFRAQGRAQELADACERAASVLDDPHQRSALWAEAGELYRGRLAQPEKAERLLSQAVDADDKNKVALEGLLALAEAKRDGGQLCRCLKALALVAADGKDRVRYLRRLAVAARDIAFDLDLSVYAFLEVLKVEPDDLPVLGELCGLQRRRADMGGLAFALEQRARVAEQSKDLRLAAASLRELGQVLEVRLGRPGEALVVLEKAARLFPEPNQLLDLAALSMRCERPANARRALEDALLLLPRHAAPEKVAEIRARLGKACDALGDKDAAREQYALAFPLRRLDDEISTRLEALYEEAGQQKELADIWVAKAQALAQSARPLDAAPLYFKAAQALLALGDGAAARARFTAAVEASPTGEFAALALEQLAELLVAQGQLEEAAATWARRAGLASEPRAMARAFYKSALLVEKTPRESTYLARALEADSTFAPARHRRAQLHLTEDPRGALADLEAVLAADPRDPDVAAANFDLVALARQAGFAALKVGHADTARRHLAWYVQQRPEDLDALVELAGLHRRAGALEALVELLGELWPRLSGGSRNAARREYAQGTLALSRFDAAKTVLHAMLEEDSTDSWANERLLELLGEQASAREERLLLLTRLVTSATGDKRAALLEKRASEHHAARDFPAASRDLFEAAALLADPTPALLKLCGWAKDENDAAVELEAFDRILAGPAADAHRPLAATRVFAIAQAAQQHGDARLAERALLFATKLPLSGDQRNESWTMLAALYEARGESRLAEDALSSAAESGTRERRVEALEKRARLLEARRAFSEAMQAWQGTLALLPRHAPGLEGLKRCLKATEDLEGLAEVLQDEATHAPPQKAGPIYRELANLYLGKLNARGPAEAALKRLVQCEPHDAASRTTLAHLLAERGAAGEAAREAEEAAGALPAGDAAPLLWSAVRWALAHDDSTLGLRLARKANTLGEAQGENLELLADLLYVHGAVAEALPLQRRIVAAIDIADRPEEAERHLLRLADLAETAGEHPLAIASLERLIAERPLNFVAVERLAALLKPNDPRASLRRLADYASLLSRSVRAETMLRDLGRRAFNELHDVEMASNLLRKAIDASEAPLELVLERNQLLRGAGLFGELFPELPRAALLLLDAGRREEALAAYEEEVALGLRLGHVDEAIRTLRAMADVCQDAHDPARAAAFLRRQAEVLVESRLDLEAAQLTLERAWGVNQSSLTAEQGVRLARRRGDAQLEIVWLERTLPGLSSSSEKAKTHVALARLYVGLGAAEPSVDHASWSAPAEAEAQLKAALALVPRHPDAEALLFALYERFERAGDQAAYLEDSAESLPQGPERAALMLRAAALYKDKAGMPREAAVALLAARSSHPDDDALTEKVADLLYQLGQKPQAAEFDGLLLAKNIRHAAFARHLEYLDKERDDEGLAELLVRRAEVEEGEAAASWWLRAAAAYRRSGAVERAKVCEQQAFERSPASDEAFGHLVERVKHDVRAHADVLWTRARARPDQKSALLLERARLLEKANEALLAAAAWDDVLQSEPNLQAALLARGKLAFEAGGAKASLPYDRRLLDVADHALELKDRIRIRLRIASASMDVRAWKDAATMLEAALELDPAATNRHELLSTLLTAYNEAGQSDGVFSTSLRLAKESPRPEAEALYRRAAALHPEPSVALDALLPLFEWHPSERALFERVQEGLLSLGRDGELVAAHERFAQAIGGAEGARVLFQAMQRVETKLLDATRAYELLSRAVAMDPSNLEIAEAWAVALRKRRDVPALLKALERLATLRTDDDGRAQAELERAALLAANGQRQEAVAVWEHLRAQGPASSGYAAALVALESAYAEAHDEAQLWPVLKARAALVTFDAQAELLTRAAQTARRARAFGEALDLARQASAVRPSFESERLVADVALEAGDARAAGEALVRAAESAPAKKRSGLLVEAFTALETASAHREAASLLSRILKEFPKAIEVEDAARRFVALGAKDLALDAAFAPLLEQEKFDEAWQLASDAGDAARATEALWAGAKARHTPAIERLLEVLKASRDADGVERLLPMMKKPQAMLSERAARMLFFDFERRSGLEALEKLHALSAAADEAIASGRAPLLELLLPRIEALGPAQVEALLDAALAAFPERKKSILNQLLALRMARGQFPQAVAALGELAGLETDPRARAALRYEQGMLLLKELKEPKAAAASFEKVLIDDAMNAGAVRELFVLLDSGDAPRFIAIAERLKSLLGPDAAASRHEELASAYEAVGRAKDAYALLATLPASPKILERRVRLGESLGLLGDVLALKERLATTDADREKVLLGYLSADLIPFAVRLAGEMLQRSAVSFATQCLLAQRLAPTPQGSALAVRLWPEILKTQPIDVDGWTLFGEALAHAGLPAHAPVADAVGAVLSSSNDRPRPVALQAVVRGPGSGRTEVPGGALQVTSETMPRLFAAIDAARRAFGAAEGPLYLDPAGGCEVWLAAGGALVMGALALTHFGEVELKYACAVALALGDDSEALRRPGQVRGVAAAAVRGFDACPSTLAAGRVLSAWDERVRGGDPAAALPSELLPDNPAFDAVLRRVIDVLAAAVSTSGRA